MVAGTGKHSVAPPEIPPFNKRSKKFKIAVDTLTGRRLYTLHNEGGAPLAAIAFALVKFSKESRVSDTLPGLSRKQIDPRYRVAMSVL